jgi:hypothetical protein
MILYYSLAKYVHSLIFRWATTSIFIGQEAKVGVVP